MAAQAWKMYNTFKRYLGDGSGINLETDTFKMVLLKSTSNATTLTLSRYSELTGQVDTGQGYSTGGKIIPTTSWVAGLTSVEMRFKGGTTGTKWSCNGTSISSIMFAVIYDDTHVSDRLVCWASLSASIFSVTGGNSLTVTPNATNGFFELNSA